jgi:hypothetical protein
MATRLDEKAPARDDEYARESFTFRRMRPWQIWTLTAAVVVILIGIFAWM